MEWAPWQYVVAGAGLGGLVEAAVLWVWYHYGERRARQERLPDRWRPGTR